MNATSAYITKITFQSQLPHDQVVAMMRERMPFFAGLKGLTQKYYVESGDGRSYSGIYYWDSKECMDSFLSTPLKESIASAYKTTREPEIEILPVLFTLHPS